MVCWLDSGVEEAGQPNCLTEYQCDGTRPVCQRCSLHGTVCVFSETVDVHHTFLRKRRYSMLEERSGHEHQVLGLLKVSHRTDALRILECLRAGDDAYSVVDFAHDPTSAHLASGAAEHRHQKHTHILSSKVYWFRHDSLLGSRVVGRMCESSPRAIAGLIGLPFTQPLHDLHTRLIRFLARRGLVLRLRGARPSKMRQMSSHQRGGRTSLA